MQLDPSAPNQRSSQWKSTSQDHADPDTAIRADGYSVLREILALANGQRQVALDLGLSLPGLASTTLTLAVGQRPAHSPWLAVTNDDKTIVRTAQARRTYPGRGPAFRLPLSRAKDRPGSPCPTICPVTVSWYQGLRHAPAAKAMI
jgi:hypothetical protein